MLVPDTVPEFVCETRNTKSYIKNLLTYHEFLVQLVGSPMNARHFLVYAFLKLMSMSTYSCRSFIRSVLVSSPLFVLISRRSLLLCLCKIVVTLDPFDEKTVVLSFPNLYQYLKSVCKFLYFHFLL